MRKIRLVFLQRKISYICYIPMHIYVLILLSRTIFSLAITCQSLHSDKPLTVVPRSINNLRFIGERATLLGPCVVSRSYGSRSNDKEPGDVIQCITLIYCCAKRSLYGRRQHYHRTYRGILGIATLPSF